MTTLNNEKLSLKSKLCFTGAVGGNTIISYIFMYFIMIYFTDVFGISPAAAGALLFISRIWDAVNDPAAGIIIDRTKSSKGKARPYLLYLAIPTAIFLVLTFTTPSLSDKGKLIWAYVTYIGLGMCLTLTMIATLTLMPRMTKNPIERVSLSAYYLIGSSIFGIVVAGVFTPLVMKLGKDNMAQGYQLTASAFGLIIVVLFLLGYFGTREIENGGKVEEKKNTVSEILKSILRNPPFIILALIGLISGIGAGLFSGSLVFYLTYYMKRPDLIPVFMPIYMIMTLVASITSKFVVNRIGKKKGMYFFLILIVLVLLIRFITKDSSPTLLFVLLGAAGLNFGYFNIIFMTMLTDTTLYGELKTGVKVEGVIMSAYTFQGKMGMGIGGALLGFILQKSGYVPNAIEQTQQALTGLFHANVTSYLVAFILCFILILFYKLDDKKMQQIQNELAERSTQ